MKPRMEAPKQLYQVSPMVAAQMLGFRPMELAFVLLVLLILIVVALMVRTRKKGEDD